MTKATEQMQTEGEVSALTDTEIRTLVGRLLDSAGADGVPEEDFDTLLAWASRLRVEVILLEAVLRGEARVRVANGEVQFSRAEATPVAGTKATAPHMHQTPRRPGSDPPDHPPAA